MDTSCPQMSRKKKMMGRIYCDLNRHRNVCCFGILSLTSWLFWGDSDVAADGASDDENHFLMAMSFLYCCCYCEEDDHRICPVWELDLFLEKLQTPSLQTPRILIRLLIRNHSNQRMTGNSLIRKKKIISGVRKEGITSWNGEDDNVYAHHPLVSSSHRIIKSLLISDFDLFTFRLLMGRRDSRRIIEK